MAVLQAVAAETPGQRQSSLRWRNFSPMQSRPSLGQTSRQESPQPVEFTSDYLQRMDADADGRVSLMEYLDWMGYAFDARDANRDGTLTADELPGGKGRSVTREQHRQGLAERFRKQDADGSGFLDTKELAAPPR